MKTIEVQGKNQIFEKQDWKPKEKPKPKERTKAIKYNNPDNLLIQEEAFNRLFNERIDEIRESSKKIKYNNLTHHYITPDIRPTNFIEFRGASHIFKETKTGDNPIQTAEKEQIKL